MNKFLVSRPVINEEEEEEEEGLLLFQNEANNRLADLVILIKSGRPRLGHGFVGLTFNERNLEQIQEAIDQLAVFKNAPDGSWEKNAWNTEFGQREAVPLDEELHLIIENFADNDTFLA